MTAIDPLSTGSIAPRATANLVRVVAVMRALYRAWRSRRDIARLAELSDHQLADIGLTRDDIRVARRAPLATDPTTGLAALIKERGRTQEAARRVC